MYLDEHYLQPTNRQGKYVWQGETQKNWAKIYWQKSLSANILKHAKDVYGDEEEYRRIFENNSFQNYQSATKSWTSNKSNEKNKKEINTRGNIQSSEWVDWNILNQDFSTPLPPCNPFTICQNAITPTSFQSDKSDSIIVLLVLPKLTGVTIHP